MIARSRNIAGQLNKGIEGLFRKYKVASKFGVAQVSRLTKFRSAMRRSRPSPSSSPREPGPGRCQVRSSTARSSSRPRKRCRWPSSRNRY